MRTLAIALCIPFILLAQTDNQEFRSTWVITWHHSSSSSSAEQNKARIRSIMDNHVRANMNAVLFQVRQNGTAYYPSSYEPWGAYIGDNPGFDPLAYAVEQAHARGLELHAWMNTFESRGARSGSPASDNPEWVCRDGSNNPMTINHALSPGLDTVRSYLVDVAMEIVRNYDIDGLHLDYVRWNEYTTGSGAPALSKISPEPEKQFDGVISPDMLEALLAAPPASRYLYDLDHPYGDTPPDSVGGGRFPTWEDYWRWCVTEFVSTLHDSIRAAKPWVRFSTAALGKYNFNSPLDWNGYYAVFQDAALWFNQGYIDQLTPMHYHWDTGNEFLTMLAQWRTSIQPGIDDGRLYSVGPGSYKLAPWGNHEEVIEACRTVTWVDGFQFFSSGSWDDHMYWDHAGMTFFGNKTKVRATGLIFAESPEAPTILVERIDSLSYQLTVTPPVGLTSPNRFAIYQSEDAVIDTVTDTIVDIHFGSDPYTFTETFSGLQDYNGTYYYGATTLDRYWNESTASSSVETDSIPSYPPLVVTTYPAEGDTVRVSTPVSLTFSKTVDTTTFAGALSIEPDMPIQDMSWTADWASNEMTVTLQFTNHLLYDTTFTLTLLPSLVDVNGVPLDGNGDGVGGDPFTLHFITEPPDTIGPVVLASYPDISTPPDSILRDDVVTLVFDERLDPASITAGTILLTSAGTPVPAHYKITNVRHRTVLSLQPEESNFSAGATYTLLIGQELSDSVGNPMEENFQLIFPVSYFWNTHTRVIDEFMSTSSWERPGYSGSTSGIVDPNTTFSASAGAYLPSSPTRQRSSARLHYEWMDADTTFLLRDYLSGTPRDIAFSQNWVLQCFVFGDGSHNQFRFALDDGYGDATNHEVSQWITIDWLGWRLLMWDLSDGGSFGSWLGNGLWDYPNNIHFDSFQLTHDRGSSQRIGDIYFDKLQVVQKDYLIRIDDGIDLVPERIILSQNYPNPFNAVTTIPFFLPQHSKVELAIYDLRGRLVKRLVRRELDAGYHLITWQGDNRSGAKAASGVYLVRLGTESRTLTRQMVLLK
ncbi:family 10 glycosylhydrolase [Candidatus Neomarinimicrobiota bacterium]